METQTNIKVESVVEEEDSEGELASWQKVRSTEQLLGFIARREAALAIAEQES